MNTCEGREMEALSVSDIRKELQRLMEVYSNMGAKKYRKHDSGTGEGGKKTKWEYVLLVILEWKSTQKKNKSNKQESKHPGAVSVLKTWDIRI